MSDERTVLDVIDDIPMCDLGNSRTVAHHLGIDPDMPFDQFQRWLRWGQRVETAFLFDIDHVDVRYEDGWDACLEHIKGGEDG